MRISQRKLSYFAYVAIIWLGVFVPGHLGGFIVEQLYVAFVVFSTIALFATCRTNSNYFEFNAKMIFAFFFVLEIFYVISYLHAEIRFPSEQGGFRDYVELARYLIYLTFAMLVLFYHPRNSLHLAESLVLACIFYSIFVAFVYIAQIPILSEFFEDFLYVATRDDLSQILSGGRVRFAAPFPNSNYLAYFLCMAIVILLFFATGFRRLILFVICLLILFLTGSRTGWLTSLVILILWFLAHFKLAVFERRNFGNFFLLTFLSMAILGLIFSISLPSFSRLSELNSAISSGDLRSVASLSARLDHSFYILNSLKESWIFGLGPAKYSLTTVIDNQYLLWITRQGIIGLIIIFIGIYLFFRRMIRAGDDTRDVFGILSFFAVIGLFGMTGAFLNNFRLLLITLFFAAVIMDQCQNNKNFHVLKRSNA